MTAPDRWLSLTQAERDAAYDNTAAVPDRRALAAARTEASARLRQARPEALDRPYGAGDRQMWDLFPSDDRTAPWFVFIHGGYWQKNGREDFASLAKGALDLGWSAALPGYTLAPQTSLGGIVAEIGAALDWVSAYRADGGFSGPLILGGWSAGACLAALHLDHPSVALGLALSGVYDLAPLKHTYLDAALRLTAAEITDLSPLRRAPVLKPLLMAVGGRELPALIEQTRACHAKRLAAGAPGALLTVDADHFTILDQLVRTDSPVMRALRTMV